MRGRTLRSTLPDPTAVCPLDSVDRQFRALWPNALRLSGVTAVATWLSFVYVAFVMDGLTRLLSAARYRGALTPALCWLPQRQARHEHRPAWNHGLVHHSERRLHGRLKLPTRHLLPLLEILYLGSS